ncbi:MAG TPA: GNAT family N-acetyltransferase [Trebonia sp.]|jgi:GNAT superfamily N-acetyltransferase|nr:GNAT family N-acetyltransferase [Trebonia sp.]
MSTSERPAEVAEETPAAATVRPARPADVPAMHELIRALAEYEQALDEVTSAPADLHAALFQPHPAVFAHVAEHEGGVVGCAIWFVNYSTWTGQHGLYLEDLFVTPRLRRGGVGAALLAELAAICVERGYPRLDWAVLDWNEPAQAFYRSLGAVPQDDWTLNRVSGEALTALARRRPAPK